MRYFESFKNINSPIIFTCEHASSSIPPEYDNLGLTRNQLERAKDLFDPGALDLAIFLNKKIPSNLVYPLFSRLLIDANRNISTVSHANKHHAPALKTELLLDDNLIPIPGNLDADEALRWNEYVKPYYLYVKELSQDLLKKFDSVYLFQIHSFYPEYSGETRKEDIGIIHNNLEVAKKIIKEIDGLEVGDNKPWGMEAVGGGVFHNLDNINVIGIDVNNKHLESPDKIGNVLYKSLKIFKIEK